MAGMDGEWAAAGLAHRVLGEAPESVRGLFAA